MEEELKWVSVILTFQPVSENISFWAKTTCPKQSLGNENSSWILSVDVMGCVFCMFGILKQAFSPGIVLHGRICFCIRDKPLAVCLVTSCDLT